MAASSDLTNAVASEDNKKEMISEIPTSTRARLNTIIFGQRAPHLLDQRSHVVGQSLLHQCQPEPGPGAPYIRSVTEVSLVNKLCTIL